MPLSIKTKDGVKVTAQSWVKDHRHNGKEPYVLIALEEEPQQIVALLTPEQAEVWAAKVFWSAQIARYVSGKKLLQGRKWPRPTRGPVGITRIVFRFKQSLEILKKMGQLG